MRPWLACACAAVILAMGCGKEPAEPQLHKVMFVDSSRTAAEHLALRGQAFITEEKLKRKISLSGISAQLLDRAQFEKEVLPLQREYAIRSMQVNIFNLHEEIDADARESLGRLNQAQDLNQASRRKVLARLADADAIHAKYRSELDRFKEAKWSSFTYVDPFTGRQRPSGWFDSGATLELMSNNAAQLLLIADQLRAEDAALSATLTKTVEAERARHALLRSTKQAEIYEQADKLNRFTQDTRQAQEIINEALAFVKAQQGPEGVDRLNVSEIITALDKVTIDKAKADDRGGFEFRLPVAETRPLMCYAYYGSDGITLSWILQVQRDELADGGFRKLILDEKNSIDQERWSNSIKMLAMNTSINSWVQGF